jgi:hypothetical protein
MTAQYSAFEKHREALREVEMRRSVYERRVEARQMSRKEADRKIAIMEEIAAEYAALAEKERLV